jgi:hypothetical protein
MCVADLMAKRLPFARRAGIAIPGRERTLGMTHRLEFVWITTDLSAGSRRQILASIGDTCPVVEWGTSSDVFSWLRFGNAKVIGFRRHPLSADVLSHLSPWIIIAPPAGAGSAAEDSGSIEGSA